MTEKVKQIEMKRILIIEDDPDILEVLSIIFIDENFELVCNSKGMSAEEVALIHPDLILLDVRITGFEKTGSQLCQELKKFTETSHLPVILLSAEANLPLLAASSGADAHIPKPFDIDELLIAVKKYIK